MSVDVLSQGILTGDTSCQAVSGATATFAGGNGGSGGSQQGLVNLFVANNTIQVPVGLAANICGISAAVLAQFVHPGAAHCNAQGNGTATG